MDTSPQELLDVYMQAERLYTKDEVEAALDQMAQDIAAKLSKSNPLLQCVMLGGLVTSGKLLTRLDFPLQMDYLHATRYKGDIRGSDLKWIAKPTVSLKDRVVLVIDDILDEGVTLEAIEKECMEAGAAEVYSAVLLDKLVTRENNYKASFVGLEVEDRFVFGYGMDYKGYLRNAPGIYAVNNA